MNADIALDKSDCIKSATHFGFTHYVDVCSGRAFDVQWGGADWLLLVGLSGFGFTFMVWLAAMAVFLWRDS